MSRPLLAFDVEVYPNLYFAVFRTENGDTRTYTHNDYLDEELFTEYQLVGFNSNSYDDAILDNWGLEPSDMKALSDKLIAGEEVFYKRYSLDIYRQLKNDVTIGVSCPGLKEIAFNKGRIPKQTPVGFNDDVPEHMYGAVVSYCVEDVIELWDILNDKKEFVDTLLYLHDEYNFDLRKTVATNIDRLLNYEETVTCDLPLWRGKLREVLDEIATYDTIEVISSEGGLHGAEPTCDYDNAVNLDITSQYPFLIVLFGLLGEKTPQFKHMLYERVQIKKTKPIRAGALKIVLNTTYGVLNSDKGFFKMENAELGTLVCIYGQYSIASLMLKALKRGAHIIQVNTDGLMFKGIPQESIDAMVLEWEREFGMNLEQDNIVRVIQKDVNNYAAVFVDHVKTKGMALANSQGRRIYKKNQSVVLDKMIYNILFDRPIAHGVIPYDYARWVRPTSAYPSLSIGDRSYTEGVVVMPWDESGDVLRKRKPNGQVSKASNLDRVKLYQEGMEVPVSVELEVARLALDAVFGRYRKDGEPFSSSRPWIFDRNKKKFLFDLLDLS